MTCKDCYHCEACENRFAGLKKICVDEPVKHLELNPAVQKCCKNFKDKSRIIELPMAATDRLKDELTKYCYERCVDEL